MPQFVKKIICALLLVSTMERASAFSLLGPFDTWQNETIGYNLSRSADIGGPMNLGEEWRWGTPIIYAYESSFLDYFGQRGVEAVEAAIKIINDLPAMSSLSRDLSEFPLDTRRYNFRASALNLQDLKSFALSALLEQLGLASPERYVWTLRGRVVQNNIPTYTVIKRNFDPVTLEPSSYVNGTLYSYQIAQTEANPDVWEAVAFAVDPLAPTVTAVVNLADISGGFTDIRGLLDLASPGFFYTGLTRDDVGALRYIYQRNNLNQETLPGDAAIGAGGGGTTVSGGSGGASPWIPIGGTPTGTPGTGTGGGTGVGGGAGGVGGAVGPTLVTSAVRPGQDKIRLLRGTFDSGFGQTFSNVVTFTDTFLTNGATRQQTVTRTLTAPDIVFAAEDLPLTQGGIPTVYARTVLTRTGGGAGGGGGPLANQAGPGNMLGPVRVVFSKIGPALINVFEGSEEIATRLEVWGSYDASTNAPIVYPSGLSIEALERAISGGSGASPFRLP